ncbi:MAG: PQQ-binding-like beta-propeller repeat protein [Bryobacterales bacterium]|nr:PQQ-binding-like beta-propeller repeat protein [Bryobacterales bacterium]
MKALLLVLCLVCPHASWADEWSRFRGPNGTGVSTDTGFPVEFGPDENLLWKAPVRPGKSSPVLTKHRVFVTAFDDGKLFTQCFDRASGKLLWERSEDRARTTVLHKLNEPAAPTPVTDGENVYVFFAELGLLSYDPAGKLRWKVALGPFSNSMGVSSSPILNGDSLVLQVDQEENPYVAAFASRNGEILWKTERLARSGWATPVLHRPAGAKPYLLTVSSGKLAGYDLQNGARVPHSEELSPAIVASPALAGDTIYAFGYGFETPSPFAGPLKRFDKDGDGKLTPEEYGVEPLLIHIGKYEGDRDGTVTSEEWEAAFRKISTPSRLQAFRLEPDAKSKAVRARELWRYEKNFVGVIPSPLLYDGTLYVIRNGGILTSFDAESGEVAKMGRVDGAVDPYSSSPVAAEGRLYVASEEGKVAVLKAGREWEVLKVNDLGEPVFATPALSQGVIYVRTAAALYAFGKPTR